jgi:hypothetical protein
MQIMSAIKRSPDQYGLQRARAGLEEMVRQEMVNERDLGPVKMRNPVGIAKFNGEFLREWNSAYSKWVEDSKDPWQFLTEKNAREMMNRIYPPNKRAADNVAQAGETGGEAQEKGLPLPPVPEGVNERNWNSIVAVAPRTSRGQMTQAAWADAIQILMANPALQVQEAFDRRVAQSGIKAKDVLERLGINPIAATIAAEAKPSGAAPVSAPAPQAAAPIQAPVAAPTSTQPVSPVAPTVPAYHGGRASRPPEAEIQAQEREVAERRAAEAQRVEQVRAGAASHPKPGTAPVRGAETIEANKRAAEARRQEQLQRLDRDEAEARENITNKHQLERELKRIDAERESLKK